MLLPTKTVFVSVSNNYQNTGITYVFIVVKFAVCDYLILSCKTLVNKN